MSGSIRKSSVLFGFILDHLDEKSPRHSYLTDGRISELLSSFPQSWRLMRGRRQVHLKWQQLCFLPCFWGHWTHLDHPHCRRTPILSTTVSRHDRIHSPSQNPAKTILYMLRFELACNMPSATVQLKHISATLCWLPAHSWQNQHQTILAKNNWIHCKVFVLIYIDFVLPRSTQNDLPR